MSNITQAQALEVIEATRTIYYNTIGTNAGGTQVVLGMDNSRNTCWLVYDEYTGEQRWRVLSMNTDEVLFEANDVYEMSEYIINIGQ